MAMPELGEHTSYGNDVLYRMCKDRPLHNDIDSISSKLWLIGRSYAASIERKAGDDFDIKDAAILIKNSELDEKIDILNSESITTLDNVNILLSTHIYLLNLFKEATGIEKRSLASKYLHFHSPNCVFIYDSVVKEKIREQLRPLKKRFKITKKYDNEYESHVHRCIYYRDEVLAPKFNKIASPRNLDAYLYGY